ncbi:ATP-dependent RNA helicase, partial [Ascosphaera atra]
MPQPWKAVADQATTRLKAPESKARKRSKEEDSGEEYDGEENEEEWGGFSDDEAGKGEQDAQQESQPEVVPEETIEDVDAAELIDAQEEEAKDEPSKQGTEPEKKETEQKGDGKQGKKEEKKKQDQKQVKKQTTPKNDAGLQGGISFTALEKADDEEKVDISAWDPLNLKSEILISLSKLGFSKPTPIQEACIPSIIHGRDVVGKASTGSGKTLAFGIPIIEHYLRLGRNLLDSNKGASYPIALILSPTRELAHQISNHISELSTRAPNVNLRVALLTGGLSVQKQQRLLRDADVVI